MFLFLCLSLLLKIVFFVIVNSEIKFDFDLKLDGPIKLMKTAFYFILKLPFVLEIFTFLYWLLGYAEKQLDKKARLNLKFIMTSKTAQPIITVHIYCSTSQEVKAAKQLNLVS